MKRDIYGKTISLKQINYLKSQNIIYLWGKKLGDTIWQVTEGPTVNVFLTWVVIAHMSNSTVVFKMYMAMYIY